MVSEGSGGASAQEGSTPSWSADGWSVALENPNPQAEAGDQPAQEPPVLPDLAPHHSGNASNQDEDEDEEVEDEDEGGEYDPESVTITTAPAPVVERPSSDSPRPSKKPKTAGGFIVGSSDDEDDTPVPAPTYPGALKPTPSDIQARPFTRDTPGYSHTQAGNGPSAPPDLSADVTAPTGVNASAAATARSRLPTDVVGLLEDRIKEDPRGDLDAWLALIDEQKRRHKIEDARAVYERFLEVFPQAAEIWVAYVDMELSLNNYKEAEGIFTRTLLAVPSVQLWTTYLNYVRRINDLSDPTGRARQTVSQSYEFVLGTIGQDRDSAALWQDYIQFIKTGPGQIGGAGWQDQQKMDLLRKAYQRATAIPLPNLSSLWREYDLFEMGLNKMTGRKFIQERSPSYITARSAHTYLENITRGLQRTTLPRLPPAPGFEGDQEYLEQVSLWKGWIAWEKDDPLVIKADDPETYRLRVLHVYKQALMALRYWPEMWVDAAEWCFSNGVVSKAGQDAGLQFLIDGIEANPESSLLALKHADRIESTQPARDDDTGKVDLAQSIREPYDKVLETLYGMIKKLKDREAAAISKIEEEAAADTSGPENVDADEEDEGEIKEKQSTDATKSKIKAIQDGFAVQIQMLSQHISYLWIALARTFRRLQGQGQGKSTPATGIRGIFTEARLKGRLTSDVYLEIAHMEWDVYQDNVATKIFDRGAKLFPEQEYFIVEYLKHLHARRDFTNARVVFSQTVQRFKGKPELVHKLKPIYAYFHSYEARFGELAQIKELEKQMAELFPEDPSLAHFAARFSTDRFNPITARVIISPARQMRPKAVMQSVEHTSLSARSTPHPAPQAERSPQPQYLPTVNSPKRPFQADDQDDYPPRKLARGASPLKGAAGRRLDQQRRAQQGQGASSHANAPAPIPRDITFLLGLIPPAEAFRVYQFNAEGMVRLIRDTPVPSLSEWRSLKEGNALPRMQNRHAAADYPIYTHSSDSPGSSGRPTSPFGGMSRTQSSAPYRNSPLRPGSSGSYEPPPAVYQAPGTVQFNPLAPSSAAENAGFAGWPGGFLPSTQYNVAQPQHQTSQYGGYY
ncbi:hypothetical protein GGS23DRAFT_506825 [Durotheca rogersii]|uniref:uncharacterized protein n=1 Tax=Durotheca rogersii TaxID=419775 RepID=UPI00221FDF01|nr:uncharacterized protein GGS23DRAFT_506825 [Durotheca rogersii]KAI5863616.1 hypothetical protein GGS23DRAFT_506825 [Durotheca rogersii]